MHARSSTETSCAVEGLGRLRATPLNASEHESCRSPLLLRSKAHVAFVYKADRASGIERVSIENLLILHATRAARRLIAASCDDPDRRSAGGGAGRTGGTRGPGGPTSDAPVCGRNS